MARSFRLLHGRQRNRIRASHCHLRSTFRHLCMATSLTLNSNTSSILWYYTMADFATPEDVHVTIQMELRSIAIQQAIEITGALVREKVQSIKVLQHDMMSKFHRGEESSVHLRRYVNAVQRLAPASLWSSSHREKWAF